MFFRRACLKIACPYWAVYQVENGWTYFLHGWTQVISEVFHVEIATGGPAFDAISEIAVRAAAAPPPRPGGT